MNVKKSPSANLETKKFLFWQIGLAIILICSIGVFEWSKVKGISHENAMVVGVELEIEILSSPKRERASPPAPKPIALEEIIVVSDETEISEELEPIDVEATEMTKIVPVSLPEEEEEPEIFFYTQELPKFKGGIVKLYQFINRKIRYPSPAFDMGIEGKVYVQFVVKKNGEIAEPKIIKGVHPTLDEEAIRVVNLLPNWLPGKQGGRTVDVHYTLPIVFRLSK